MKFRFLYLFLFVFFLSSPAIAQNSDWVSADHVKARLISEEGRFGVELQTEAGWHTYTKNAGDAGLPTQFDFAGSKDLEVLDVIYPPHRDFDEFGLKTYGYEGNVFFPMKVNIGPAPQIILKITGAICKDICIPYSMEINTFLLKQQTETKHVLSFAVILTAFLAGLILNIMPCVLPVLSLKVLSIVKTAGKKRARARGDFIMTSFGIITSFMILAVGTVAIKSYGLSLGWGMHFQSPYFIGFLLVVVLFFAASMFGLFELNTPSWIGGGGKIGEGLWGNFMSGVLATTLGTSCTAPVLVTAVSFAFAGTYLDIFIVFFFMGIGMALPFLIFALFPRISNILPKPGPWMVWFRNLLGVFMIGTAIWLCSILYTQLAEEPEMEMTDILGTVDKEIVWRKFKEEKIAQLVADGRVVFVDITAKWCVNCQTNKLTVIETDEIHEQFLKYKVVLLRGDMTKPSPVLLDYIKKYDRPGIPFNIVYGPSEPNGLILPPLLNKQVVTKALEQAAGK